MTLIGKQKRHLRSLGHALEPVLQIGKSGVTDAVIRAIDDALGHHELVKVRLGAECDEERRGLGARLASATRSELAQLLGRTLLVYRAHPEKPRIKLPG